jgi:hypothetical protein
MEKNSAREKDLKTPALPAAVARVAAAWLAFSEALGNFNARLLLGVIYFIFLTPLALLYRLFNGNPVNSKADPSAATYFKRKNRLFVPADLEKPW